MTACVPNNDGDRIHALLATGKLAAARALREKSVTLRTRRPRRFGGLVTYDWEVVAGTAEHFPAIATMAAYVSAVGLGIDAALTHATFIEQPTPARGVRYAPSPTGRRTLNVPYRGAFDELERRYRAARGRMVGGTLAPVWESPPRTMRYDSELDLPSVRCEAFALRRPDDRPLAVEGTKAMEIAAMVRHAIGSRRTARRSPRGHRLRTHGTR